MESRVAKLESAVEYIQRDLADIKADIRDMKQTSSANIRDMRHASSTDFRIMFGALIAVSLGLAGLMAKGFQWI
ncbi:hypothetical protein D9O50_08660 [Oxalobacteraceae bacterium CAVE-383]|nr:hypothetical protein D9O50_08660 [Oxalobacteraceae bacterium CAVE-383]